MGTLEEVRDLAEAVTARRLTEERLHEIQSTIEQWLETQGVDMSATAAH